MYEYGEGKVEWMAYGLPVEGERGPFAGSALVEVPTCLPGERPADVAARLDALGGDRVVVVNDRRVVLGAARADRLRRAASEGAGIVEVMELSPSTIRPHVELSELDKRAAGVLVTTPDGVLLGAVDPAAIGDEHRHRHADSEAEWIEAEVHGVLAAIEERFGEREPTADELRELLRDRLLEQGRRPEDADRVLAEMDERAQG